MNAVIEETVRRCTEPLRGDWTLQQEVAQELRSHLEERCAELEQQGLTPEECAARAVQCFGAPEEIGAGLFRANFHRLRRWTKVRLLIRILTIPALAAVLFLAVNFDVAAGAARLRELRLLEALPLPEFLLDPAGFRSAVPPGRAPECSALRRGETLPEDPAALAGRIAGGCREQLPGPELLDAAIQYEPENALYRYEKAAALAAEAVPGIADTDFLQRSAGVWPELSAGARRKLERAAESYRGALLCPRNTDYAAERNRRHNRRHYPGADFHAAVGRLADAAVFPLPQLAAYRQLGRWIPFYAERLIREGRTAEAEALLDSWKRFALHQLQDCDTVVGVLALGGILVAWQRDLPPLYTALGKPEKGAAAAGTISRMAAPVRRWREEGRRNLSGKVSALHGGILSAFSAWNPQETPDPARLAADRRITYALCDQAVLLCFGGIGVGITLLFGLIRLTEWLRGRRAEWLRLSGGQVCRLLCFGILLPLVLCWMLTHVDGLSGRDAAVFRNPRIWLQWGCFLFVLPVWFLIFLRRLLEERARFLLPVPECGRCFRFFRCGRISSILPLWILFLLISVALARWSVDGDLSRGLAEEHLVFSGFPTAMEERWTAAMKEAMRQAVSEQESD